MCALYFGLAEAAVAAVACPKRYAAQEGALASVRARASVSCDDESVPDLCRMLFKRFLIMYIN